MFVLLHWRQEKLTLRNHAPRSYTTWLPVTLTWLLNKLQLWRHRRGFRKLTVRFRPIRKEIVSLMYNNFRNYPLTPSPPAFTHPPSPTAHFPAKFPNRYYTLTIISTSGYSPLTKIVVRHPARMAAICQNFVDLPLLLRRYISPPPQF